MKITKYVFALFIFCTLFTSCVNNDTAEEEALFNTIDIQTTGDDGTPIDDEEGED